MYYELVSFQRYDGDSEGGREGEEEGEEGGQGAQGRVQGQLPVLRTDTAFKLIHFRYLKHIASYHDG